MHTYASFTVKLPVEKRIGHNLEMHACSIDLEKAYDKVNRIKLSGILEEYKVLGKLIRVIENLYNGTKIKIQIDDEERQNMPK